MRSGAFYTICNYLVRIGKRFKDTLLRDIAVELAVIAEWLIEAVSKADNTTGQSGSAISYIKISK